MEKTSKSILDSALLIAVASAICYGIGYLAERRDARAQGLLPHLLPERPPQATVLLGAEVLLVILLIALAIYVLAILLLKLAPPNFGQDIVAKARSAFEAETMFYRLLGVVIVGVAVIALATWVKWSGTGYEDRYLPDVVDLHLKKEIPAIQGALKYVSHRDHWDS